MATLSPVLKPSGALISVISSPSWRNPVGQDAHPWMRLAVIGAETDDVHVPGSCRMVSRWRVAGYDATSRG